MSDWILKHKKVCDGDEGCMQCYHIEESLWAISQAQEEIKEKKNKVEPKPHTNLEWDYKLKKWREVIK